MHVLLLVDPFSLAGEDHTRVLVRSVLNLTLVELNRGILRICEDGSPENAPSEIAFRLFDTERALSPRAVTDELKRLNIGTKLNGDFFEEWTSQRFDELLLELETVRSVKIAASNQQTTGGVVSTADLVGEFLQQEVHRCFSEAGATEFDSDSALIVVAMPLGRLPGGDRQTLGRYIQAIGDSKAFPIPLNVVWLDTTCLCSSKPDLPDPASNEDGRKTSSCDVESTDLNNPITEAALQRSDSPCRDTDKSKTTHTSTLLELSAKKDLDALVSSDEFDLNILRWALQGSPRVTLLSVEQIIFSQRANIRLESFLAVGRNGLLVPSFSTMVQIESDGVSDGVDRAEAIEGAKEFLDLGTIMDAPRTSLSEIGARSLIGGIRFCVSCDSALEVLFSDLLDSKQALVIPDLLAPTKFVFLVPVALGLAVAFTLAGPEIGIDLCEGTVNQVCTTTTLGPVDELLEPCPTIFPHDARSHGEGDHATVESHVMSTVETSSLSGRTALPSTRDSTAADEFQSSKNLSPPVSPSDLIANEGRAFNVPESSTTRTIEGNPNVASNERGETEGMVAHDDVQEHDNKRLRQCFDSESHNQGDASMVQVSKSTDDDSTFIEPSGHEAPSSANEDETGGQSIKRQGEKKVNRSKKSIPAKVKAKGLGDDPKEIIEADKKPQIICFLPSRAWSRPILAPSSAPIALPRGRDLPSVHEMQQRRSDIFKRAAQALQEASSPYGGSNAITLDETERGILSRKSEPELVELAVGEFLETLQDPTKLPSALDRLSAVAQLFKDPSQSKILLRDNLLKSLENDARTAAPSVLLLIRFGGSITDEKAFKRLDRLLTRASISMRDNERFKRFVLDQVLPECLKAANPVLGTRLRSKYLEDDEGDANDMVNIGVVHAGGNLVPRRRVQGLPALAHTAVQTTPVLVRNAAESPQSAVVQASKPPLPSAAASSSEMRPPALPKVSLAARSAPNKRNKLILNHFTQSLSESDQFRRVVAVDAPRLGPVSAPRGGVSCGARGSGGQAHKYVVSDSPFGIGPTPMGSHISSSRLVNGENKALRRLAFTPGRPANVVVQATPNSVAASPYQQHPVRARGPEMSKRMLFVQATPSGSVAASPQHPRAVSRGAENSKRMLFAQATPLRNSANVHQTSPQASSFAKLSTSPLTAVSSTFKPNSARQLPPLFRGRELESQELIDMGDGALDVGNEASNPALES